MSHLLSLVARCAACIALAASLLACTQSVVEENTVEPTIARTQTYSYTRDVKPILDAKCIACHACYDAPCQLKLTSGAGLLRGATSDPVYNGSRVKSAAPTRLFVDAHGQAEWRQKGFFAVLNDQGGSLDDNLVNSLLYNMIELGRMQPLASNEPVPDDIKLGLQRDNECPRIDDFEQYARDKPRQGMPLALSGLARAEFETLRQWIFEGAVIDQPPFQASSAEQQQIAVWEAFFNAPTLKGNWLRATSTSTSTRRTCISANWTAATTSSWCAHPRPRGSRWRSSPPCAPTTTPATCSTTGCAR